MEKKCIILITLLLSSFLFTSFSYCEGLTEREWEIFNKSCGKNTSDEELCEEYGITADTLGDIRNRVYDTGLSEEERATYEDYIRRLRALPESYTEEDNQSMKREFLEDYGISESELNGLFIRYYIDYYYNRTLINEKSED